MLMRIIVCALLAGAIAGGVSALLQQALVIPVLLEAETYERGEAVHFKGVGESADAEGHAEADASAHAHAHADADAGEHEHADADAGAHEHADDGGPLPRWLRTTIMTVANNVGFALLLIAGFYARSDRPSPRQGLVWGTFGFVAFMLAPAAGLAPELPGIAAAALEARQIWWVLTAVLAAGAFWLIAFVRTAWAIPVAIGLLVLPHIVGAPHPDALTGPAPPELAGEFAARTLAVGFISWAILGGVAAWIWNRQAPEEI